MRYLFNTVWDGIRQCKGCSNKSCDASSSFHSQVAVIDLGRDLDPVVLEGDFTQVYPKSINIQFALNCKTEEIEQDQSDMSKCEKCHQKTMEFTRSELQACPVVLFLTFDHEKYVKI